MRSRILKILKEREVLQATNVNLDKYYQFMRKTLVGKTFELKGIRLNDDMRIENISFTIEQIKELNGYFKFYARFNNGQMSINFGGWVSDEDEFKLVELSTDFYLDEIELVVTSHIKKFNRYFNIKVTPKVEIL